MYNSDLSRLIIQAISRLNFEMEQTAPAMAQQVLPWLKQLAGQAQPDDYFKHPLAFPALLLPWWAEQSLVKQPDLAFQADLAYSTINGYYYIRLIDNLMDGHATIELELLPALNFFHTQFQTAYQPYFISGHPFWNFFQAVWFRSGEAAMQDANLTDIDETLFSQIAAQKVCAAKIPLAAVCYRYERPDLIDPWSRFVDLLGCWHQMHNDLFDWSRDEARQTCTYFLSEARRRRNPDEPVAGWVARAGFTWAIGKLQGWLVELKKQAGALDNLHLLDYLASREAMLLKQKDKVAPGLQHLARITRLQNR
jgi:hypothetical protein